MSKFIFNFFLFFFFSIISIYHQVLMFSRAIQVSSLKIVPYGTKLPICLVTQTKSSIFLMLQFSSPSNFPHKSLKTKSEKKKKKKSRKVKIY